MFRIAEFPNAAFNPLAIASIRWTKGIRWGDHPSDPRPFRGPGIGDGWYAPLVIVRLTCGKEISVSCRSNASAERYCDFLQAELTAMLEEFQCLD